MEASEKIISLEDAMRKGGDDEFWAIRGKAVQAYANLEQALCKLFGQFSETHQEVAGIIFFKITNTQSRNSILEKLFKKKFHARFAPFRNSLIEQLRPIDIERNEIVHWNAINNITPGPNGTINVFITLKPPAFWDFANSPTKTTADLIAFIDKCSFYSKLCAMFHVSTTPSFGLPEDVKQPWLDIFARPITYPPQADHPLFPKPLAPASPHPLTCSPETQPI